MWMLSIALAAPPPSIAVGELHDTTAWVEAPSSCIDPVGKDGPTPWLENGPVSLGTWELEHGKTLDTPWVRFRVYGDFIPTTMGASTGDHVTNYEVVLKPNIDQEKPSPFNTVYTWVGSKLAISTFQALVTPIPGKKKRYRAELWDVGCREVYMVPELKPGESRKFWLSTDGVRHLHFRELSQKYLIDAETLIELSADLDPDVQQGDTEDPHGWYRIKGIDRDGGAPIVKERVHYDVVEGESMILMNHTLTVLKVERGPDTRLEDGKVFTKGKAPRVRMLLGIARAE